VWGLWNGNGVQATEGQDVLPIELTAVNTKTKKVKTIPYPQTAELPVEQNKQLWGRYNRKMVADGIVGCVAPH
jgi:hypothetical protein